MITLDTGTFIVILVAAALGGAALGVIPAWMQITGRSRSLPLWGFLRRGDLDITRRAAFQAELRCEMCDSHAHCRQLLARGARAPEPGCPNAALFKAASGRKDALTA